MCHPAAVLSTAQQPPRSGEDPLPDPQAPRNHGCTARTRPAFPTRMAHAQKRFGAQCARPRRQRRPSALYHSERRVGHERPAPPGGGLRGDRPGTAVSPNSRVKPRHAPAHTATRAGDPRAPGRRTKRGRSRHPAAAARSGRPRPSLSSGSGTAPRAGRPAAAGSATRRSARRHVLGARGSQGHRTQTPPPPTATWFSAAPKPTTGTQQRRPREHSPAAKVTASCTRRALRAAGQAPASPARPEGSTAPRAPDTAGPHLPRGRLRLSPGPRPFLTEASASAGQCVWSCSRRRRCEPAALAATCDASRRREERARTAG